MRFRDIVFCTLAVMAGFWVRPTSAAVFSNVKGGEDISALSVPDTTNYGETFTAPGEALLDWQFNVTGGTAGNVDLVVAGWDGTQAIGPALYRSADLVYAGGAAVLDFSGIGLELAAASHYIAYLTLAGVSNPATGLIVAGSAGPGGLDGSTANGSLGGAFMYANTNGADPLTSGAVWASYSPDPDMQFSATFGPAAVPEPASLALLGAGMLGIAARRRRKTA